jgi:putative endonuclease
MNLDEQSNQPAKLIGNQGEDLALKYLQDQGFKLLYRNFRTRHGEIDLIMQDKDILVFIEIKLRSEKSFISAEQALSEAQIHRIAKTALTYITESIGHMVDCRFDLITVDFKNEFYKLSHTKAVAPLGEYLE